MSFFFFFYLSFFFLFFLFPFSTLPLFLFFFLFYLRYFLLSPRLTFFFYFWVFNRHSRLCRLKMSFIIFILTFSSPFSIFPHFCIFLYPRLIFVINSLLCLLLLGYFISDPYIIIPLVYLHLRHFFFVSPSFLASYSLFIFYFLKCLSFFFFSKLIIQL